MKDVKNAIWEARAQWKDIGRALDVDEGTLSTIRHANDGECLNEVLLKWIQGNANPTIGDIVEAMKDPTVARMDIANKIDDRRWNTSAKVI